MKLTIVGLPIGNIEDISPRAIKTLQEANFIVCEDTRVFNSLWMKLIQQGRAERLSATLRFVNDFNEERALPKIIQEMSFLDNAVLVSDAGMPLISDPGYMLVREGINLGWDIDVVPGPTAESAALAVSGLPTDKYVFLGFLPKKTGKRREGLESFRQSQAGLRCTGVIYESPVRLLRLLDEITQVFGAERQVFIGRDLTKSTQQSFRGNVGELVAKLSKEKMKGEITLVIGRGD